MKFPPYPKYKPSGVAWLGDVPEHWEVKRLRHVLSRNDGGVWGEEDDPEGTVVLRSTEQTVDGGWQIADPARRNLTPKEKAQALLKAGDLVVTKSSGSALHIGKTSLVSKEVEALQPCYSNFMQRLRVAARYEPRLVFYVLNSPTGRQQLVFNSNTTTGLANLNAGVLGDVFICAPPPSEQQAIAAFLDRETGRLDRLVGRKRELIERLKEKRTALISRTVTRGLPPAAARAVGLPDLSAEASAKEENPTLKPSGLPWLGDIPSHWEVKRLKLVAHLTDKKVEADDGNPVPYIGMENIEPWTGRLLPIDSNVIPTGTANAFKAGHTLFGKLRPYLAKACNPDFDGLCSTELLVLNGVELDRVFLRYALLSDGFIKLVDSSTYGSKMPRASWDFIGNCEMPIPPLPEQAAIAAYLDRETAKLDALVAKVEAAIERLQEYRTALITAAVTGKIDVRGAAPTTD
jgi:type I restriction enzyme S subunit